MWMYSHSCHDYVSRLSINLTFSKKSSSFIHTAKLFSSWTTLVLGAFLSMLNFWIIFSLSHLYHMTYIWYHIYIIYIWDYLFIYLSMSISMSISISISISSVSISISSVCPFCILYTGWNSAFLISGVPRMFQFDYLRVSHIKSRDFNQKITQIRPFKPSSKSCFIYFVTKHRSVRCQEVISSAHCYARIKGL